MLIAALFTRYGGNLRVCQQMNGPIGYVVYTHAHNEILLIHKKEWNFAICNNTDGLGEYFAKWNKSDREIQILYDVTYTWNLKTTIN